VCWFVGGTDPALFESAAAEGRVENLPVNHAPNFAPVIHPTLRTGIESGLWLADRKTSDDGQAGQKEISIHHHL
jgi:hypothetical protein